MKKTKKIEITISNEKLELLRKIGLSPEDVFFKGFETLLRRKYREISMIDEEDELEIMEIQEISQQSHKVEDILVSETNILNN